MGCDRCCSCKERLKLTLSSKGEARRGSPIIHAARSGAPSCSGGRAVCRSESPECDLPSVTPRMGDHGRPRMGIWLQDRLHARDISTPICSDMTCSSDMAMMPMIIAKAAQKW